MCWVGLKCDKIILEKDKTVFKILSAEHVSPCQDFKYTLNQLYTTKFGIKEIRAHLLEICIHEGFHSYNDSLLICCTEEYIRICMVSRAPITIYKNSNLRLYKCTIPKGSTVYINYLGEVVSDKIIINEVLNIEEFICYKKINDLIK